MIARSVQTVLEPVLKLLRHGDLEQARQGLQNILQEDLENPTVLYTLKGVKFWEDRLQQISDIADSFSQGEYIIAQWAPFLTYMKKEGIFSEPIIYALKCYAFTSALRFYGKLLTEDTREQPAEIYRKTGLCYKALGDYDTARECLNFALSKEQDSPPVLAELADAYALAGEIRWAKLYFREAFFKGASKIELPFLESGLINSLIARVASFGYSGKELAEWLPIYGKLDGVLTVKRELRALEIGRLKQSIYSLESELKSGNATEEEKLLKPRLINYYFWLIDHYINISEDKRKIDEILLRIKLIDTSIYNRYVGIA
ncbi:hypothetical protein DWQ65_09885 [Treponema phagedenis]|uniref:Tetratricopeptide repeat protein n=1 Tax=Treponema phagedenis TaxID=162 RepID=A0A0B7GUJ9_TREPH|nr:hypothetical protein [Treponema phagedenis]NVP23936.1 hypothetical protein [Treponema phagedenis]QEJ93848.1 hypothetical protein FUT79_00525 [Treponema phagedenis]QEJ96606.1 hypothetical protein FUT82_00325 [Treponema phagedenis]QEJ99773.1 hypothetical protein FUT84_00315 [Treponema phagedenis]QEK02392.1 hypothetical protein FUT83_00320 [Treponema phagedenis]